ncbi:uncharacterized protein LOC135474096 [Liolophura sinensis]|uniref:uncharacterized protein LOC135474096 n=1 Tax=Liolophura sinensis TaxID=3198878 RepID=UPI003157F583
MTLDFPSRYTSVEYPFGFYVLNYTSRILTAQDERSGNKVDLQVVPVYTDDIVSMRNILCELETRGKLKHKNLLSWTHLFAFKNEDNPIPSLCLSFPSSSLTLLDMIGYFPVCPWPLTHDKVAWMGYQLVSVLHYLHCCKQVVLHLPLRNIHVSMDGKYDIQLQDFGWKYPCFRDTVVDDDLRQCRRFSYKWNGFSVLAPEVLAHASSISTSADMWNFGCVLAMLLTRASLLEEYPKPILCSPGEESMRMAGEYLGKAPAEFLSTLQEDKKCFFSSSRPSKKPLDSLLLPEVHDIPTGPENSSSSTKNASDLIARLLAYPSERMTSEEAMSHPYFAPFFSETDVRENIDNAIDVPAVRTSVDNVDAQECAVRLHRSVAFHELQHPLELYSLQDICIRTIESSHCLAGVKKMIYPRPLVERIVEGAESLTSKGS